MANRATPDNVVMFRGIENGVLILIDTNFKDYEKVIKKTIQKLKENKKFFTGANIFIDGMKRPLDSDEIGMARKLIRDKLKLEVTPYRLKEDKEEKKELEYPLVIERTLRAGQVIQSNSDVIVFGDVNPGASVISSGSIYIYGKLRGEAHAGHPDVERCIITANGFTPLALSIGDKILELDSIDEKSKNNFCFAKVVDQEIKINVVSKILDE
ncbi:MAG TPA: septum site-determining protein MinC [Caldisericia bacterium]|nr:septum site-determining protein MinC [Caldisericia bacterium]HPO28650.1 septum site-determining protein MinC [Caldisericia bacterium]